MKRIFVSLLLIFLLIPCFSSCEMIEPCKTCNDTQLVTCETCRGKGKELCEWCSIWIPGKCGISYCKNGIQTQNERCSFCEKYDIWGCGSCYGGMVIVKETCRVCDGTGLCFSCNGSGLKENAQNCSNCNGKGKVSCPDCSTTSKTN